MEPERICPASSSLHRRPPPQRPITGPVCAGTHEHRINRPTLRSSLPAFCCHTCCVPTSKKDLADFLKRARSACDPQRAGLPVDHRIRRVPGLRREEVALLAGVSTDYYTRLEQGRHISPSSGVLDSIARALNLDEAGRAHLGHLTGVSPSRPSSAPTVQRVRPGLYQILESLPQLPALVLGRRTDVLAANRLAQAVFAPFDSMKPPERNYARWMFLDQHARDLFIDWEDQARAVVETLRFDIGHHPDDRSATALIADLAFKNRDFERWWTEHRVYQRTHGTKHLHHPVVGALTLDYETFAMPGDSDQNLFIYTTPAGTPSRQAMELLGILTASTPAGSRTQTGI